MDNLTREWREITEFLAAVGDIAEKDEQLRKNVDRFTSIIHNAIVETIEADGGAWVPAAIMLALASHLHNIAQMIEKVIEQNPTQKPRREYLQCTMRDDTISAPRPRKRIPVLAK